MSQKKKKTSPALIRIRLLFTGLVLVSIVLVGKLYLVQIVHSQTYRERADHQYVRPNQNLYNRGSIYFTEQTGTQVPAATLHSGFTVALNPADVENPEAAFSALEPHLALDQTEFLDKATKKDDPYEVIAEKVPSETAEKIEKEAVSGVSLYRQKWRYYPGATMAAHTLGFVAYQGDTRAGRYGIERYYEDTLKRASDELYVNFFAEVFSNVKKTLFQESEFNGDIITGIEPNMQAQLEQQLAVLTSTWDSKYSGGIVMDPRTGQIYAMAVSPAFDLNTREGADATDFKNPLVENVYEFGSIIKPITMAIGLDTGAVAQNSTYVDDGYITLDGYRIENYDGKSRGRVEMQEVLNQSLNTGAAYVADRVGNERFADKLLEFGIGEHTEIDLPNEAKGITDNLETARDVEIANASFGQGIAMSPVAAARALAVLANGGKLVTPHVGKRIVFEVGGSKSLIPKESASGVISSSTSKTITRMLVNVVDDALAGGGVARDRHAIAAKTGTAQIPNPHGGGYYENRYLHSFFGYAPAYDPRFLVFLYTIEPQGARYSSQTLTDPFMNMVNFLINYYEIPPDR